MSLTIVLKNYKVYQCRISNNLQTIKVVHEKKIILKCRKRLSICFEEVDES